jgi:hypothetical protein
MEYRTLKRLRLLVVGAITLAIVIFLSLPRQTGDPDFDPRVKSPAYGSASGAHPVVLIDQAHFNVHTMAGRYKPLADLLRNDGYDVRPNKTKFTAAGLAGADVLIVANALGLGGSAQQLLTIFRLDRIVDLTASAFGPAECDAVAAWVRDGGSLLLVADHAPTGKAAARLSARFEVGMTNGWAEDDRPNHDPVTDHWGYLLFARDNGLLGDHPVTRGRDASERVRRVVSFTGQALKPPPSGVPFLLLSPAARLYLKARSADNDFISAAGLCQGVALEYGRGRVVVLGEAAMLTSQKARGPTGELHFGLDWPGADNRRLALNILHWLSRLPGFGDRPEP